MAYTLPPEIWRKIIGEYGLLSHKNISTIKMIPSRHCIMETVHGLLQQYMDYICNLCHSVGDSNIINRPNIFNKQNLFNIIKYINITVDDNISICRDYDILILKLNNIMIKIISNYILYYKNDALLVIAKDLYRIHMINKK